MRINISGNPCNENLPCFRRMRYLHPQINILFNVQFLSKKELSLKTPKVSLMELTGTAESTISWLTRIARVCVNIFEHGCVCVYESVHTIACFC